MFDSKFAALPDLSGILPRRVRDERSDEIKRWQRRAEREKSARREAERLLETKSLELFTANRRLSELNADLERRVEKRTRELAKAAAVRGEFLSVMSHEIRTPMTGVLGMIDLLRAEQLTARQRNYVDSVHASGRHLLVIINDILDFSRMESGRIELEQEDFSLALVVERARSMLNPLALERGLDFRLEMIGPLPPPLRGDSTRVLQVLLNVVGNAIKFTARGSVIGAVTTKTGASGLLIRFEVHDTGIGISDDRLLFEPFAQADRSTTRKFGGSGLGLAISKRLVDAMGGEIGAQANAEQGSLFWFEIPFAQGSPVKRAKPLPARAGPALPRRILVVEDIALNRDVIDAMLGRQGHALTFAVNGREALERVQAEPFDLVLMDVQMPVMDGVQATRLIRLLPRPAGDIPIIALTANVMAAEQSKCLEAGMNSVLLKPIDWEKMTSAIDRYALTNASAGNGELR